MSEECKDIIPSVCGGTRKPYIPIDDEETAVVRTAVVDKAIVGVTKTE